VSEFKFRRSEASLRLDGVEIDGVHGGAGTWVSPFDLVRNASLASFRRAVLDYQNYDGFETSGIDSYKRVAAAVGELYVSPADREEFSVDYSDRFPASICVLPGGTLAVTVETPLRGTDLEEEGFAPLLAPLLARYRSQLLEVVLHGEGTQVFVVLRLRFERRGAKVADAIDFGLSVEQLLLATRGGSLDANSAFTLIAVGRAALLIGQRESAWLEVKSQSYDLSVDKGRIELGQDVARFANGDVAGLLVIGCGTKKAAGVETISKLTPSLTSHSPARFHKAIDDKVFPPILGLEVNEVALPLSSDRQGYLLAILVPAQPEESKPVLVHGAIVDGKTEGAFISIVQRRGEHSVPTTAQSIHASIAAGRALLRRGQLPS